jgi:ketosteroid isomerase-like protein
MEQESVRTTRPADANVEVARGLLQAYLDQDRARAESLLADELTFTSPQDDHIDRPAYFQRCFPTAARLNRQTLLHAVALDEQDVVIAYEYELQTGERYRNTEIITVRNGKAVQIQVFFGGKVS